MAAKEMTLRILERLRLRILRSPLTQRAVESRVGFSSGYLSRLLHGTVEIKYWHVLAILDAIGLEPSELFGELFPRRRHPALESLDGVAAGVRRAPLAISRWDSSPPASRRLTPGATHC